MEPSAIAVRPASAVVAPLVNKLFARDAPGAGLVTEPVRVGGPVSFRGEKRTLTSADPEKLAAQLVRRANAAGGIPEAEEESTALAVAAALGTLGDTGMTDVQAVGLGHEVFARELAAHAPLILTDFPNLRTLVLPEAPPPSAHVPEDVELVIGEAPDNSEPLEPGRS